MSRSNRKDLPADIDDETKYLKVTIYYNPDDNQCCITASEALTPDDIIDILSSGLDSVTEEPVPEDTGYLN